MAESTWVTTPKEEPTISWHIRLNSLLLTWGPDAFWVAILGLDVALAQVALFWHTALGVYITTAALLIAMGIALRSEQLRSTAIAVAILPLATMVNLSLPQTSAFAQLMVYYDALLLLTLTYRFIFTLNHPLHHASLGRKGYQAAIPLVVITSQVVGAISFFGLSHHNPLADVPMVIAALCCIIFAFTEEMFFRGLLQQRASKAMHPIFAAALSTILYMVTSFAAGLTFAPLVAAVNNSILSIVYFKKPNLLITISINALSKLVYIGLFTIFIAH